MVSVITIQGSRVVFRVSNQEITQRNTDQRHICKGFVQNPRQALKCNESCAYRQFLA